MYIPSEPAPGNPEANGALSHDQAGASTHGNGRTPPPGQPPRGGTAPPPKPLEAALAYLPAGLCPLPIRLDGSKAPAIDEWTTLRGLNLIDSFQRGFEAARSARCEHGEVPR